jgi:hypothetical protein
MDRQSCLVLFCLFALVMVGTIHVPKVAAWVTDPFPPGYDPGPGVNEANNPGGDNAQPPESFT